MKIHNTLTRSLSDVRPQNPPTVSVYTCGPTVYDYPHIGNWYTFIRYDILIRALILAGYKPRWIMNITDVGHLVSDADEGEDKLEKGAKRERVSAWHIASTYTEYFVQGMKRLNMTPPFLLPRATDHIAEQIDLIKKLEKNGLTYRIDDGIYYDTSKFPTYTEFAHLDLEDLKAGARVELNPQKRNHTDFALWKFSPKEITRDMEWDSPWGRGFPGWHLECSAMAMKYLGDTLDIHAGGIDHIAVHHTNEIAQSEAVTGKRFANIWMHTNHVTVDGNKISKSLGNGITLEDIESKGFTLEAFRLLVLESHYRTQSKFSWDTLEAAQNRLKQYEQMADMRWQLVGKKPGFTKYADREVMLADAENDLNTPSILAVLSATANDVLDNAIHPSDEKEFLEFLEFVDALLGLHLNSRIDISDDQKALIVERSSAREQKKWSRADELRGVLANQGLGVRDTPQGSIWYRL